MTVLGLLHAGVRIGLGEWTIHWSTVAGLGALGALYLWRARQGESGGEAPPPTMAQRISFFTGLGIIFLSLNGPLHDLSDYYLFSMHMVQHLVLTLVFPPLLLAGIPEWLLRPLLNKPGVLQVTRVLTRPWVAALLFSVSIAAWHLRPFYDLMMRSHEVHIATHLMFMVTATLMWWPVMSPLPELRLPTGPSMLYLFLVGIPMQVVAALITFADVVLYPWYVTAPRMWGLSPLDDQQLGGLIMWVPGNLYIFAAMGVLFFRWAKEEG